MRSDIERQIVLRIREGLGVTRPAHGVDDEVAYANDIGQGAEVLHPLLYELDVAFLEAEICAISGRSWKEAIDRGDAEAFCREVIADIAADEAGTAEHQGRLGHQTSVFGWCVRTS